MQNNIFYSQSNLIGYSSIVSLNWANYPISRLVLSFSDTASSETSMALGKGQGEWLVVETNSEKLWTLVPWSTLEHWQEQPKLTLDFQVWRLG